MEPMDGTSSFFQTRDYIANLWWKYRDHLIIGCLFLFSNIQACIYWQFVLFALNYIFCGGVVIIVIYRKR
jgi:hypothetical protein